MSLNIGKLTSINSNGTKIYQKVEKGVRTISSVENGKITKEIIISRNNNNGIKGFSTVINDLKRGLTHKLSNNTDYAFEENFKTVAKETQDKKTGIIKRFSITTSKDGDSVEITNSQMKRNGEEFWLTNNTRKNPNGTITKEQEFETSGYGWTKPDGKYLNGSYQSITTTKDGKIIEQERFGDLDVMPTIIELA